MQKKAARRGQRALAFLLCLLMVATLLPVMGASAAVGSNVINNAADPVEQGGLVVTKTLSEGTDGNYSIELTAYATGSTSTTTTPVDKPMDIVLVLDQSGSMAYSFGNPIAKNDATNQQLGATEGYFTYVSTETDYWGQTTTTYYPVRYHDGRWQYKTTEDGEVSWKKVPYDNNIYITRLSALKNAVRNFVDSVNKKAAGADGQFGTEDDIDYRLAMVGFASGYSWYNGYNTQEYYYGNTEVFVGATQYTYNDGTEDGATNANSAQSHYQDAFQDVTTSDGQSNIEASIDALAADGGTLTDLGIEMANGIFADNPITDDTERGRVVIVFTDGEPGWSGYDSTVANSAITNASTAKNTHRARVFSVGIFDGADATSVGNSNGNSTEKANYFMQNISSNNGKLRTPSFYLSASDDVALNNVFQQIDKEISTPTTTVKLDANAVLRDVISDNFVLKQDFNASEDVTIKTVSGRTADGTTIIWDATEQTASGCTAVLNGKSVEVTGFDYSGKYIAPSHNGEKLIVRIDGLVPVNAGTIASNNTESLISGIYASSSTAETAVVEFPVPKTVIPVFTKVLDFSMTANIASHVQQSSTTTNQYGTFKTADENLTYKLGNSVAEGSLVFDGVDSVLFYGDYNDDGDDASARWNKVNVIPANNVYFDDDLLTNQSTFTDDAQGKDDAVGTNYSVDTVGDNVQRDFHFKGTGIDVYCTTESNSGWISAVLLNAADGTRAKDADGNNIKAIYMNNQYESDPSLINVPTISINNVPYGEYILRIETMNNTNYKLDGVRIYNPANTDAVEVGEASGVDVQAQFVNVRDTLLSATPKELTEGAVYVDRDPATEDISVYEKIGPKNEVYLDKGQKVGFKLDGVPEGAKVLVGLSAPENQGNATAKVTCGNNATELAVNSAIDMYYPVEVSIDGYVVIENTSNVLLSVTNVQISGGDSASGAMLMSSPELLTYMASFDTLEVTEPTPDEPDPIPDTPVQNDSISAIIHAIWSSVRDSIGRLFGRL